MAKSTTYIKSRHKCTTTIGDVNPSNLVTKEEFIDKIQEAKGYTDIQIDKILDGVSDKLDTLKELADAINNDPNFYSNILNKIEYKANKEDLLYSNNEMNGVSTLSEAIDFLFDKQSKLVLDWTKIENKPTIISSIQNTDEGLLFLSEDGQQMSSVLSINNDDIELILQELV